MPSKSDTIYQLKITLDKIKPSIWRRVQVKGNSSFAKLHDVIQIAMGWEDDHMHQFTISGENYGNARFDDVEDESAVKLAQLLPEEHSKFQYEYDFGDGWRHTIVVEKILPAEAGVKYPRCLDGKRACPLEDSGGPYRYAMLAEAFTNPTTPEHHEMLEFYDFEFDPEEFDLEKVNRKLARLK